MDVGIAGKEYSAKIVDSDGRVISNKDNEFTLINKFSIADSKGFAYLPVVVEFGETAKTTKIYRVMFSYADRSSISYSYGPFFYLTDRTPTPLDRDKLMMKGFNVIDTNPFGDGGNSWGGTNPNTK